MWCAIFPQAALAYVETPEEMLWLTHLKWL
jgi:hypothetical protein